MADDGPVSDQASLEPVKLEPVNPQPVNLEPANLGPGVRPTGRANARLGKSIADMVRSMVVVLAVVGAILLVTWRPQPDPVREVDPAPVQALATAQADYPILLPIGMPEYRPTSARWEPTKASSGVPVWHVGYVTGQTQYVQVSQAATTDSAFIWEQAGQATPVGPVDIDGITWQQMASNQGMSLVREADGVATVVTGTVPLDELVAVVRALRPGG